MQLTGKFVLTKKLEGVAESRTSTEKMGWVDDGCKVQQTTGRNRLVLFEIEGTARPATRPKTALPQLQKERLGEFALCRVGHGSR